MTKLVAYLCSEDTISTSRNRRADAFEHDIAFNVLANAFRTIQRTLVEVVWNGSANGWTQFEAALVGSTWDYTQKRSAFLSALKHVQDGCRLFNSVEAITWNTRKYYLRELEASRVKIAPTIWPDDTLKFGEDVWFNILKSEKLIAKPIVGACSEGQIVFGKMNAPSASLIRAKELMIQAFYSTLSRHGELA